MAIRSRKEKKKFRFLIVLAPVVSLYLIQQLRLGGTVVGFQEHFELFSPPSISSDYQSSSKTLSSNTEYIEYFINITTPLPQLTLVMYDPYLLGGFRNQHMRFVSFLNFAVEHSIKQILLPSIRWGTAAGFERGHSAPHEYLFDVPYWNEHAEEWGLPRLVRYDPNVLEGLSLSPTTMNATRENESKIACFNTSSNLYSGLDERLIRDPKANPRKLKIDQSIGTLEGYSHCKRSAPPKNRKSDSLDGNLDQNKFTYLVPHGGPTRLWHGYFGMQNKINRKPRNVIIDNRNVSMYPDHHPSEKAVFTILRPSKEIRDAIKEATQAATGKGEGDEPAKFVALHPRTEHDMLRHPRCNKRMEKNMTRIFEHLRGLSPFDLLFIAINTELAMEEPPESLRKWLKDLYFENRVVLNRTKAFGLFGNEKIAGIPVFESGARTAEKIVFPAEQITEYNQGKIHPPRLVSVKSLLVTSLVAAIVDFFTVVEAEAFIGVKGSTFSLDVFAARYYMGKSGNYILGIDRMEKLFGPPPIHKC